MKKVIIAICIIIILVVIGYLIINNKQKQDNTNTSNNFEIEETERHDLLSNQEQSNNSVNETINNNINEENSMPELENNNTEPQENINKGEEKVSVLNIKVGNKNFKATLEDNNLARELIKQMPLTINMSELHGNEKYYYFNQSFEANSERIGNIKTGDLMLYGSDCLVLFYESFSTSYSYTRLGKIDNPSGLAEAVGKGNVQVTFSIDN